MVVVVEEVIGVRVEAGGWMGDTRVRDAKVMVCVT